MHDSVLGCIYFDTSSKFKLYFFCFCVCVVLICFRIIFLLLSLFSVFYLLGHKPICCRCFFVSQFNSSSSFNMLNCIVILYMQKNKIKKCNNTKEKKTLRAKKTGKLSCYMWINTSQLDFQQPGHPEVVPNYGL